MDDRSIGIIYAIKRNHHKPLKQRVIDFMCAYSGSSPLAYSDGVILRILEQTFADLVGTADYPGSIAYSYFEFKHEPWNRDKSEIDLICTCLSMVQVRKYNGTTNEYEYINGFRKLKSEDK